MRQASTQAATSATNECRSSFRELGGDDWCRADPSLARRTGAQRCRIERSRRATRTTSVTGRRHREKLLMGAGDPREFVGVDLAGHRLPMHAFVCVGGV